MIKIKPVKRKNPLHKEEPAKYYYSPVCEGETGIDDLCKRVADKADVSRVDTYNVLKTLFEEIPMELADGHAVKLGNLGSLYLTFHSEGVEKEKHLNTNHISRVNLRIRPTQEFKNLTEKLRFEETDLKKK